MGLMLEDYLPDIGCGTLVGVIPIIRYLENRFISLHTIPICLSVNVTDEGNHNPLSEKLDDCLYDLSVSLYGFNLWIGG